MMDASSLRRDFPQLRRSIRGKPIVYLDSTATSLKPRSVIDKENEYYTRYTANIFRGIYTTSEEATYEYEEARKKVAAFIGASKPEEIIFTRNTTESINLVAYSLRPRNITASIMEHHSNFVPWQQIGNLKVWYPENPLESVVTKKTDMFAITAVSNVLGTINPVKHIIKQVKKINPKCLVLVDAAQAVPHMNVDVLDWGADFVAFSSHKMLGPTGVGVLWGKYELLDKMKPFLYGGEMIEEVHEDKTVFKAPPHKFEAGTPHIAGAIGLGAAVTYLSKIGMSAVRAHEKEMTAYALKIVSSIKEIAVVGPMDPESRAGVIAFTVRGIHPHDIAQILDRDNVCIRVGFHCAQPLHEYLKVGPTARASFYVYTTREDIDALGKGLEKAIRIFK